MRLALLMAVFALAPAAVSGVVIDFDSVVNVTDNQIYTTVLNVQGFHFASGHFHITNAPAGCAFGGCTAFNGTQYLSVEGPELGLPVVMTATGGAAFDLYSLQASRLFSDGATASATGLFYNAEFLNLTGTFNGGGTVSTSLALPATPGFDTFLLPPTFVNLISLNISGSVPRLTDNASWGIDNLNLSLVEVGGKSVEGVPEPATVLLAAAGLLLIGFRQRFR